MQPLVMLIQVPVVVLVAHRGQPLLFLPLLVVLVLLFSEGKLIL